MGATLASKLPRLATRWWPLVAIFALAVAGYFSGLYRYVSLTRLIEQQQALHLMVAAHPVTAALGFVVLYTTVVACAIPIGLVLSTGAGVMFGTALGGFYALLAITWGSMILFLAARSALRPFTERLARRILGRDMPVLEGDGFSYMLAIRLVPFTPFWVVNIAAAMTDIRLRSYVAATFLGLAPITFILAAAGAGIGNTMAGGQPPELNILLRWQIVGPLLLLAVASLAPIIVKRRRSQVGMTDEGS